MAIRFDDDATLGAAIRTLARVRSEQLTDHPSASQLAEYSLGVHPPHDDEAIQEHLAVCPECAEVVLDLRSFADAPDGEAGASDLESAREWAGLERRLERSGGARPGRTPWWAIAASWGLAASLLVCVALLAWGLRQQAAARRASAPSGDMVLVGLAPLGGDSARAGTAPARVTVPGRATGIVLLLNLGDLRRFPRHRMVLSREGEGPLWTDEDVHRGETGTFTLVLPADLAPGVYEVRIEGEANGRRVVLARYSFELAPAAPRGPSD